MWEGLRAKTVSSLVVVVVLSSLACWVTASVSYDRKAVIVNGQRRILISGSIHYPRSSPEVFSQMCIMGFVLLPLFLDFHYMGISVFLIIFLGFYFYFYFLVGCFRCGPILFRRPKKEAWMLSKLMFSGMGMNLHREKYGNNPHFSVFV